MSGFKNNRVVLTTFAVLMAVGIAAAYIPLLFPPGGSRNLPPEDNAPAADNNYTARLPQNPAPATTSTATSTIPAKASLPDSLNGLQNEQKSLDDLNSLLNR